MWKYPRQFDVIVIGAGHAGIEASHAAAKMGLSTLLLTSNLDTIGKMSCNPAIGGIAKGHLVLEVDALGGLMGFLTERSKIQQRMLNRSRGPSVWAPRAQADKAEYSLQAKMALERVDNLSIKQGTCEEILVEQAKVSGVRTKEGVLYSAKAIVLSSGTFMRGLIHIGELQFQGGRGGDPASMGLSPSLEKLGFRLGRLKTGTPPRVSRRSIDFSKTEEQAGEEGVFFSFDAKGPPRLEQISCHITYTTEETKKIILDNLHRSPMYSGQIHSRGPRYCPSIEDKMVRFADKERHQIFLEPEGLKTEEIYVNGVSTSLPIDVQEAFIHSVPALAKAEIMRPAYAIEYDYLLSGQMERTLHSRLVEGLFFAGQINGTTGYEEAASQGIIAGINAACYCQGKELFSPSRSESYIGVMLDDLTTKELSEPYRMFTSRAESRLLLRQDNADIRLRGYGFTLGLVDQGRFERVAMKKELIEHESERLQRQFIQEVSRGVSLWQLLSRPENSWMKLHREFPEKFPLHPEGVFIQLELEAKYAGYIARQEREVLRLSSIEEVTIPDAFDFCKVTGLRKEAEEKLCCFRPKTVGQASRISGVSAADLSILLVALKR